MTFESNIIKISINYKKILNSYYNILTGINFVYINFLYILSIVYLFITPIFVNIDPYFFSENNTNKYLIEYSLFKIYYIIETELNYSYHYLNILHDLIFMILVFNNYINYIQLCFCICIFSCYIVFIISTINIFINCDTYEFNKFIKAKREPMMIEWY